MRIKIPFAIKPYEAEFIEGVLKADMCRKIKPLIWEASIDDGDVRQVEQGKKWIASRTIDILQSTPALLAHIEPGFGQERTKEIFADLQKATRKQGKVLNDLRQAKQGVSAALAIQASEIDPSKVAQNRKALKAQRETEEDLQILAETHKRNLEYLWTQLFQSTKDFQMQQTAALKAEIDPIAAEASELIKRGARLWKQKGAPKLRQLAALNPTTPGIIYYTHLNLTQHEIRGLKLLESVPQIKANGNRFEFHLEDL